MCSSGRQPTHEEPNRRPCPICCRCRHRRNIQRRNRLEENGETSTPVNSNADTLQESSESFSDTNEMSDNTQRADVQDSGELNESTGSYDSDEDMIRVPYSSDDAENFCGAMFLDPQIAFSTRFATYFPVFGRRENGTYYIISDLWYTYHHEDN